MGIGQELDAAHADYEKTRLNSYAGRDNHRIFAARSAAWRFWEG
jgi:hypothetical protein